MISSTDYDAVTFKKDFCDYIQNAPRQVIKKKKKIEKTKHRKIDDLYNLLILRGLKINKVQNYWPKKEEKREVKKVINVDFKNVIIYITMLLTLLIKRRHMQCSKKRVNN